MKKNRQLSHAEFFKLCEEMRNQREQLEAKCETYYQAAQLLTPIVGFDIAESTVGEAIKLTGIKLKQRPKPTGKSKHNTGRVLTNALVKLYKKLGEEVPESLQTLYETANGQPLSQFKQPEQTKVANGKVVP